MAERDSTLKVFKRLLAQSWAPFLIAIAYALWDYYSALGSSRTVAEFVKSLGIAFFLVMWFVGQWFRTAKQISDSERLSSIQESIDQLSLKAESAAAQMPALVSHKNVATATADAAGDDAVRRVLEEIPRSLKGALLILGAELERELRELLWSSGWHQGVGKATITRSIEQLEKLGVVSSNLGGSVRSFLDIRNRFLHGYGVADNEVLRAIDIGLTILRTVLAIPSEENWVYHPGVDLYSDAEGRQKRAGIHGIVLSTTSPGGVTTGLRVFPTEKTHFKKGAKVSWEWNPGLVVGESWYRHPDTDAITYAWSSSMEFVGRNIKEV